MTSFQLSDFQSMGANFIINPIFNKNGWVKVGQFQTQGVLLHPFTYPNNDTPE